MCVRVCVRVFVCASERESVVVAHVRLRDSACEPACVRATVCACVRVNAFLRSYFCVRAFLQTCACAFCACVRE